MMRLRIKLFSFMWSIILTALSANSVFAATLPYLITDGVTAYQISYTGEIFYEKDLTINYETGKIIFSSNPDGTGYTWADDAIGFSIKRPDGTVKNLEYHYETNCRSLDPIEPKDMTSFFNTAGIYEIHVVLKDVCGEYVAANSMYLVNINAPEPSISPSPIPSPTPTPTTSPTPTKPEPFLELPWNYDCKQAIDEALNEKCEEKYGSRKHKSFESAAFSINSFFDHEYPLLSRKNSLPEPVEARGTIVSFKGYPRNLKDDYSMHDGFDYGLSANAKYPDPVLAAADGIAIFVPESDCPSCGNAIYIDHNNHFQTRYYHLDEKDLNPSTPYQPKEVKKGEQIGIIGYTGKVSPKGETGSHIHFMVIEDKDRDGNFDNNIPDGLVDPYGWMPEEKNNKETDPWEVYSFFYNGKQRTGNKSYYLWKTKLSRMDQDILQDGASVSLKEYKLEFPSFFIDMEGIHLNAFFSPYIDTEINGVNLKSVAPIIDVKTSDFEENEVTQFLKPFALSLDFRNYSLFNINPHTLSFYSSQNGADWAKEETEIDIENKTATAQIDHVTQFALMGEVLDTQAPETNGALDGEKGNGSWYRSDVIITLVASDNEGGLGVDHTVFEINDRGAKEYTTPIIITDEGHYKIEFYSEDKAGNVENVKAIEFDIDKTAPEAEIAYDLSDFDIKIRGKDNLSTTNVVMNKTKLLQQEYAIEDQAGNSLVINVSKIKIGKQIAFTIKNIKYNNDPVIYLDKNVYFTLVIVDRSKKIKKIDQYYAVKGDKRIFTNYSSKDDVAKIFTKNLGEKYEKEEKLGIVILQLYTEKGSVKYRY